VAVLTRVVQEQQSVVQAHEERALEQQQAIAELTARLTALEAKP
jgi:hypothetical protein